MTQKISPAGFSSAARMASTMRRWSTSEIIALPAPRCAATAERATAAGEPAREAAGVGPRGVRRPPRARDRDEDRAAWTSPRCCAGPVLTALPGDPAHDHEENEQEQHERENIDQARLVVRSLFCTLFPFVRIDRHRLDDVVDAAIDATGKIVGAETRDDRILDDEPGNRVSERSFEAITDLDADFALVRRHDQQGAGVFVLLADLPVTSELVAIVLDRGSLQRL